MRLLERPDWGAADPRHVTPHPVTSKGRPVDTVFMHHSVTPAGPFEERLRRIQEYHLTHPDVKYADIAYNAAVSNEAALAANLRNPTVQGGATRGHNTTSLALVAIGDFDTPGKDDPSAVLVKNIAAVLRLWVAQGHLSARFNLRPHSDVSATACCGRRLEPLLQGIANDVMANPSPKPPAIDDTAMLRGHLAGILEDTNQIRARLAAALHLLPKP